MTNKIVNTNIPHKSFGNYFLTSNLRSETRLSYNIPREEYRKCIFCGNNIEDEFHIHFLCESKSVVILRNK
jgi:hypothetical protein